MADNILTGFSSALVASLRRRPCGGLEHGVFLYAAKKSKLSELHHQAEICRLTLCKVLNMPRTLSNKSAFEDVSPSTFKVSSALDDVRLSFEDVSPLTFDVCAT